MLGLSLALPAVRSQPGLAYQEAYYPLVQTTNLSSPSGLSNTATGIVAASNGVNGTASIPLPLAIDPDRPFFISCKVKVSADTTNRLFLQLTSAARPFWSGCRASVIRANSITANCGNSTIFNAIGGAATAPADTVFWLTMASDGERVMVTLTPDIAVSSMTAAKLRSSPAFQDAYNQINFAASALDDQSSGAGQYTWGRVGQSDQLTELYLQNSSSTIELQGVYMCVGAMRGPSDAQMGAPGMVWVNQSQDCFGSLAQGPMVLLPEQHGAGVPFVMAFHPNGNPGTLGQSNSLATVMDLWENGYAVGTMTGAKSTADFSGATSSHWGASTGLLYRKTFVDRARLTMPQLRNMYGLGLSMGALSALAYQRAFGGMKAIVGISGVYDLTDSFNSRGFSSVINNAYGTWYLALRDSTGADPASSPSDWQAIGSASSPIGYQYLESPYNIRSGSAWASGTAYSTNDIVFKAHTGGIAALSAYDPKLNPGSYTTAPVKAWHGDSDATIPLAQATGFETALDGAGGNMSVVTVVGGTHLGASCYVPADIRAFFAANT